MIGLRLTRGDARRLAELQAEKFGRGWRPGRDGEGPGREMRIARATGTWAGHVKPAGYERNEAILAAVSARFKPGDAVSHQDAADASGFGLSAVAMSIPRLKAAGRWPFAPARRGGRGKGGAR